MTPRGPLLVGAVALTVPLAWRRAYAAPVAVVVCAAHLAVSAMARPGEFPPQLAILPVLVAIYTASSLTRGLVAVVTAVATAVLTGAAWIVTEDGHADDFWPWMLWAGAWAAGTFVRRRTEVAAQHAARAALLEVEARTAAADSAQAERDRIAREMHDVVAHSVSVMVVQAGAERLRLGPAGRADRRGARRHRGVRPDRAGRAARHARGAPRRRGRDPRTAARSGRRAGVGGERARGRSPRGADLPTRPTLMDDAAVAGSSAGLAAYRIVQEALTNVMRHQGLVPTRVELDVSGARLCLTVASTGRPGPGAVNGAPWWPRARRDAGAGHGAGRHLRGRRAR